MTLVALALQNVRRKPFRAWALTLAVALGSAAVFSTGTLVLGAERSLTLGFSRLGADLMVVPRDAPVNLRAALLTGEPSTAYMTRAIVAEVSRLAGVRRAAPQLFLSSADSFCCIIGNAFIVGFDPSNDFTVQPWVAERLDRPMAKDDVLVGGLVRHGPGEAIYFYGQEFTVYARLGRTGVGAYDNGFFMTLERAYEMAERSKSPPGVVPLVLERGKISTVLVQLGVGARPDAIRFAISKNPEVKVVTASSIVTSVRQALAALFTGTFVTTAFLILGNVLMIGCTFATTVNERRRELGLLRAIGARKATVFRLILSEGLLLTFAGGLLGVALGGVLLRLYSRTVLFYFESVNIPFAWPSPATVISVAGASVAVSLVVGVVGIFYPARQASRMEPYDLIRAGE